MSSLKEEPKGPDERKDRLRRIVKERFKEKTLLELAEESRVITEKIEGLSAYKDARVVMFYWALPEEVDIKNLLRKAKEEKKRVTLPVIIDKQDLKPYELTSYTQLVKGPLGLLQPDVKASCEVDFHQLDLVIVPGRAFDKEGRRLGRGRGYYDRFLKKLSSKTFTIGLAFAHQIFDNLPFNPLQDQKVDLIVTS
ncbi:MAG: 5-formyltetrahydrofolate cyclo-ligase [Candidatus Omnitrophica bacterium]|nr:5-formyltetrahydrofolate cyclo-ligase [Candidatus Omnitrophota bacterium]